GIAAAIDNDIGVVGVAPGARLWSLRWAGATGVGLSSDVDRACQYARDNYGAIDVINMSFGGPDVDSVQNALIEEIVRRGVIVVASAGNDAIDISDPIPPSPADLGGVVTVGAMADSD